MTTWSELGDAGVDAIHRHMVRDGVSPLVLSPEVAMLTPAERELAQAGWNVRLYGEYVAAAQFAQLAGAVLVAGLPAAMATCLSRFSLDETRHVELFGDIVTALGGRPELRWLADPVLDFPEGEDPALVLFRHVLRVCSVGETVSYDILAANLAAAEEPAIAGALRRALADEATHAKLGWPMAAHLAARLDRGQVAAEIEAALAHARGEFAIELAGPEPPPAVKRLGTVSAAEFQAIAAKALDGKVAGAMRALVASR